MEVDAASVAGGDAAPGGPPDAAGAQALQTSPELDPFRIHPSFTLPPASAPPLVSSTTVESFVMVGTQEAEGSGILVQDVAPGPIPEEEDAPPTDPGADPTTADPAGDGDAPVGSRGGLGVAATALVVLTISTLPAPSDAHSLSVYTEVPVMKMFDFVDSYILVTLFCVWIITSYVFVAGIAYLLGRVSSPARAHGVATLRPLPRLAVSDLPSSEPAIFTTRYGKYWHRTRECDCLELSTQVLARQPCVNCVRRTVGDGVAETPPGSQ
jgi:hypothetical protein